jgi:uncharacterized protein YggE
MTRTSLFAAALSAAALTALAVLAVEPRPAAPAPPPVPGPAGPVGPGPGGPARPAPRQAIVVVGRGTVEAQPDRAIVTVGAQAIRPAAQESQERVNAAMTQVLGRVAGLGIPRDRIQTVEISLLPQRNTAGAITGYQAVQRVAVTVDDLALVGRVFDAAVAGGANLLDGVAFTLRDPSASRSRALAAAFLDARAAAGALAGAAGVGTLRLVRIEEAEAALPQPRSVAFAAPATPTPVLPGTLSVSAQVRVVYGF